MRWLVSIVVGFLAIVGVWASLAHYVTEPYNPGFREFPMITAFHVILGGVYLVFAPFQFVQRIRRRWPVYHRWAGRALVAIGMVIGVTALFMGFVIPAAGRPESVVIGVFGSLFLLALGLGFVHARAKRKLLHREWMLRSFAIGLAIASTRVISIPILMSIDDPTDQQIGMAVLASQIVAFILHAGLAEVWIRHTRRGHQARGAAQAVTPISSSPPQAS